MYWMKKASWPLATCAALGFLGAGCANQAEMVRPEQANISSALGDSATCTPELLTAPNGAQRFVVEWSDADREALETEMAHGVALVKYTCDGIELLRSCAVPGEYGYRASRSQKTKTLQITDAASASANLSTPTPGAAIQAAMEQGKALNLAYVMIGSMTTPVKDVTRDQIDRSACKEATHFIYQTQVGAFAIAAGERGQAVSAAEVLGYGNAEGQISSERQALSADGDAEACKQASARDEEPPEGCGAMMRISIIPVIDGKIDAVAVGNQNKQASASAASAVDTRTCPTGAVYVEGACVAPSQTSSYLCKRYDLSGCETQCKNGSLESCGRMGEAFLEEHDFFDYYDISQEDEPEAFQALKKLKPMLPVLNEACEDEEEANACTLAALIIGAQSGPSTEPSTEEQAEEMLPLMGMGCYLGNSTACSFIVEALGSEYMDEVGIEGDGEMLEHIVSTGCDSGSARACLELGGFYYKGNKYSDDPDLQADIRRAAKYTARACHAGVDEACFWGAALYATNDANTCLNLINQVAPTSNPKLERYVGIYWPELHGEKREGEVKEFCQRTAQVYDTARAQELSNKACYLSGGTLAEPACAISKTIAR